MENNLINTVDIKEQIDEIAIQLVSTLDRNDLVHILLDMVEPKIMIQNILTTAQEQEQLRKEVGTEFNRVVCYDCQGIQNKLRGILHNYNHSYTTFQ